MAILKIIFDKKNTFSSSNLCDTNLFAKKKDLCSWYTLLQIYLLMFSLLIFSRNQKKIKMKLIQQYEKC